jgi:hypothetical protein
MLPDHEEEHLLVDARSMLLRQVLHRGQEVMILDLDSK